MYYTYIYRDPSRHNEEIYVGKGKNTRAFEHLKRRDVHPLTHRLQKLRREGVEPTIEIVQCGDEDSAFFAERALIRLWGRKDRGEGTLLNLTDGGDGVSGVWLGRNHSEETKTKMSAARTGRRYPVLSAALLGKSQTPQARQATSKAMKGNTNRFKPCTVDGLTVFESLSALIAALGHGKRGYRSPHFRYVIPNK